MAHIPTMGTNWAIVIAGALIAAAVFWTGRWTIIAPQPGGLGIVRLDRWTGAVDVCALDPKSMKDNSVQGAKLSCQHEQ